MVRLESKAELVSRFQTNVIQGLWRRGKGVRVARTGWKGPRGANVPRRKEGWARVEGASGAVYMAKGASPEPYRSLTLKFKETDNSFPFRRASVLQYHIPFLSFHCLVKPALIIKDCYPGSYAWRGKATAGKGGKRWNERQRAEEEKNGWRRREERRACERRNDENEHGEGGTAEESGFHSVESFQVRCYIIQIADP